MLHTTRHSSFHEAITHFLTADTHPVCVLALFPDLIPPAMRSVYKVSWLCTCTVRYGSQFTHLLPHVCPPHFSAC